MVIPDPNYDPYGLYYIFGVQHGLLADYSAGKKYTRDCLFLWSDFFY